MPNSANIPGQGVPPEQQQTEGTAQQRESDLNLNFVAHPVGSNKNAAAVNVPSGSTTTRSRKSRSSKTSSRALRASLDLQRLEEEKRLEKEFLARKYEILQAQLEDGEGSSSSGRTRRSSHGSSQRTHDWVQSQIVPTTSTTTEPPVIPVGTQSRTGTIPKDFPPAVAVTTRAMIMDESSVLDMRSLSINPNTVDQVAPKVQCAAGSSFAPTRHRLAHLLAKNTDQTTAVNCATDCEGAVGGCTTISTDHRALPTAVNFSISPTRTPEALMEQLSELQQRVDSFQQQLLVKTPCQGHSLDRHPDEPRHFQPTQSSTVNVPKPARKVAYDLPTSDGNNKVTSSVSQTCSNTISAFVPQLNVLSSVDLSLPTRAVEQINKTPPPPTGPCLLPPILPFVPAHMSTPQAHSTPPSVHTVSSRLSPIMSPMVLASAPITAPVSAANDVARRQLFGPTSQQLAARHVVPRELPAFTGDPVEWPLFLSCYQNTTDMCGYSDGENLMRLQRCLKGNALEAVRSHLMHPSSVPLIIDTLKTLYGRPEQIINSLLSKLRATPTPKSEHLESLIGFGLACKNLCSHLQAAGLQDHLSNPLLLQELVSKLPATLKLNWSLFKRQYAIADLTTFGSYMDQIVTAASEVTFLSEADGHRGKQEKPKTKEKMFVHTSEEKAVESVSANRQENKPKPCAACKKDGHRIKDCHSFRKMQLADRWKLVQERFLCRRCFGSHGKFPCKASNCGENGCEDRHHKLLHPGNPQLSRATDTPKTTSTVTVHRQFQQAVLFRIIPVSLNGNGKTIRTYAFLDDGSSKTLVEAQVAEELGVTGAIHPLCLQWTSGVERVEDDSQVIKLQISGATNSTRLDLKEVHTVKSLNLPVQSLDFTQLSEQFPHLQGLPVHSYTDAVPTILIGLDNSFVMTTRKSREGARGSPIAAKSRLGWTVYGNTSTEVEQSANQLFHISVRSPEQELHDLVKEFFALESVNATSSAIENDDDKRARQILEATTVRTESGRFQTGLLWKYDHVEFPNSRPMAEKRFRCLERRLASKPDLFDNVKTQISQYQVKGVSHSAMEMEPRVAILQDLKIQSFDTIRFASYRTACKLRYVQKSTNLHLVDIWNVIEAFRENGLNTLEHQNEVSVSRLETLVSSLYHNLNKRLPPTQQVPVDSKASLLLNWLLAAYSGDNSGKIRVFSIKVALAIMCAGKMVDKLRYIFSQISDGAGQLIHWKLGDFLREVLALPAAVFESPTFHYQEGLESEIFPVENKITVNDFMAVLMSEPGPACLVWLPLLHRLATVEAVVHPTICSVCLRENFTGFRYRCQRCHAYQLCQDCFWQGRVSLNHQNDHEVKEYSSYKSPSKQIGHSLRKSFRCVPEKPNQVLPRFPEQPEKTLNLSHIVPPSPLPSHNGFQDGGMIPGMYDRSSTLDSRGTGLSLDSNGTSVTRGGANSNDEEHRLIARYAARLAQESRTPGSSAPDPVQIGLDSSRAQRELIMQLESKNKEIMREIQKLRRQQEAEQVQPESPALMNELRALRQRKGELEGHLGALQDSRRQLMAQLEGLMRMLKNHQTQSPRSTPNSSPRSGKSPPLPQGPQMPGQPRGPGMPPIVPPHLQQSILQQQQLQQQQLQQQQMMLNSHMQEPPGGMMGHPHPMDMRGYVPNGNNNGVHNTIMGRPSSASATGGPASGPSSSGRNDLHYAADSVSSAMSSLVRELNSVGSDEEYGMHHHVRQMLDFEEMQSHEWSDKDNVQWQEQFAQWSLNSQNQ